MSSGDATSAVVFTRDGSYQQRHEAGATNELEACRELAAREGLNIAAEVSADDASTRRRTKASRGLDALLERIAAGDASRLICWDVDRLAHSAEDALRIVSVEHPLVVHAVCSGTFDLETASGRKRFVDACTDAISDSGSRGGRRREANGERRAAGEYPREGPRRFGYSQRGEPMVHEAAALRKAATDVRNGYSLRSIAEDWNARGLYTSKGKRWSNLQLRRVLMNPVYAGLVTHGGKIIGVGNWEPLWDRNTHDALVSLLSAENRRPGDPMGERSRGIAFRRQHMGSGFYRCGGCDAPMYAVRPHGNRAPTYICRPHKARDMTVKHAARVAEPLDEYVGQVALKLLHSSDIRRKITSADGPDLAMLQTERRGLRRRKDDLATLLAEGALTMAGVRRESQHLDEQIDGITATILAATRTSAAAALVARGVERLDEHWHAASADVKGKIAAELLTVTVLPVPKGEQSVLVDVAGRRRLNTDFVRIDARL